MNQPNTLPGPWPQQIDLGPAPAKPPAAPAPRPAQWRDQTRRQWVMEAYGIAPRRSRYR